MLRRGYSALLCALPAIAVLSCQSESDRKVAEGRRLAAEHRWTEAVESYKAALRSYPRSYAAAWGIAEIHCVHTHHFEPCLRWTDGLLEAYPDDTRYRRARAIGLRDRAAHRRSVGDVAGAAADEREAERLSR